MCGARWLLLITGRVIEGNGSVGGGARKGGGGGDVTTASKAFRLRGRTWA